MSVDRPLEGIGIVLTRARTRGEALRGALVERGARVIVFPCLEIAAEDPGLGGRHALASLASVRMAVFVSANAVEHGLAAARAFGPWPPAVAVAAIGEATATALREAGFARVISPSTRFDSESLLGLPELQAVKDARVVIFRGVGGREDLRRSLEARGATVDYVQCYRRVRPSSDPEQVLAALKKGEIRAVHAMSGETVDNFMVLAGEGAAEYLRELALVVPHEAISRNRAARHFGRVIVAAPDADAMQAALLNLSMNR